MTLEISLRRPFTLPRVFWAGNGESQQDYHWVGHSRDDQQEPSAPGEQGSKPQNKGSKQKYRPLTDITIGEVDDAIELYKNQLLPAHENWLGKKYFCQIPLKLKSGRSLTVFGRVKTCYPSDGYLDNIEEMELYLPRKDSEPDVIHIHKDEISRESQMQVQSYFVRVRVLASAEEKVELDESTSLLSVNGFYPEFDPGVLDLLDMNEGNQSVHPWLYVVGSRWFGAMPESLHAEMNAKLKEMIGWGKQIFNYHPEWLPNEVNTLNRTLGFKYGFTSVVLTEPGNAQETAFIVNKAFERMMFASLSSE